MHPKLYILIVALLLGALSACKAGRGDPCKEDNDCKGSLSCCKDTVSVGARGMCLPMDECTGGSIPTPDSGSGGTDTGAPDTGAPDTGAPDTGAPDTGAPDTGTPDSGTVDAGNTADAASVDASTPDAAAGADAA